MPAATVRIPATRWAELEPVLLRRYPKMEWASFFHFGWRLAGDHAVITIASIEAPQQGDLDETIPIVGIMEPYSVRTALAASDQPLALGVIHSHPQGFGTVPSPTDDDMDAYYSDYLGTFLPGRPYASLIFAQDRAGHRQFSGRVWLQDRWYIVEKTTIVGEGVETYTTAVEASVAPAFAGSSPSIAAYGGEAALKLQASTVSVVGVGGTGSAVAEVLARAGVGRLVLVDHDMFEARNLERLHGSKMEHVARRPPKVELVREMCLEINPGMEVVAIAGNCLDRLAVDWLVRSDLVMGCTDTSHSRVALSELAYRYVVPVIDLGVQLDGHGGQVSAEVIQFTRYTPGAPCIYCRDMVDSAHLAFELMPPAEQEARRQAAAHAETLGLDGDMYWKNRPQLLTVGHLTTTAAGMGSTYAVGLLTGRFKAPASHFQCDVLADGLGYVPVEVDSKPGCACAETIGYADQGAHRTVITAPAHWPGALLI